MRQEEDLPHDHTQHQPTASISPTTFTLIDDTEVEEQGMTWGWFVLSVVAAVLLVGGIVAERSYERRHTPTASGAARLGVAPPLR